MLQHGFFINNSHRSIKLRHLRGFVVVCLASLFGSHDVTKKNEWHSLIEHLRVTQKLFRRFQDRKRMTRSYMIIMIASSTLSFSSFRVTRFWRGSNSRRREQEKEKVSPRDYLWIFIRNPEFSRRSFSLEDLIYHNFERRTGGRHRRVSKTFALTLLTLEVDWATMLLESG